MTSPTAESTEQDSMTSPAAESTEQDSMTSPAAESTEQDSMTSPSAKSREQNVYFEKLLASLKLLQDYTGMENAVQNAITKTKALQSSLKENVLDKTPKYADVITSLQRLRLSLDSLDDSRGQAIQLFAHAQGACLNLSKSIQVKTNSKYQTMKASVKDATAVIDVDNAIISLKKMQDQVMSAENQNRLQGVVGTALEKTTALRANLAENFNGRYNETITAITTIRVSLKELSVEKKGAFVEYYVACQESLLSFTARARVEVVEKMTTLKDKTQHVTAYLGEDIYNAIEAVKTMDKAKMTAAATSAYEKTQNFQKSFKEKVTENKYYEQVMSLLCWIRASKYFEQMLTLLCWVQTSLQDTVSEKKASAIVLYTRAKESFIGMAEKIRNSEKANLLVFTAKNRVLDTAVFLDDQYSLWPKVQFYADFAMMKGKVVLEHERVVGAIDAARALDDKFASGKVNNVVGKGCELVEVGTAYLKDEVLASRQRQADIAVAQPQ